MESFTAIELAQAWTDRKNELQNERLKPYGDLLYKRLEDMVLADPALLQRRLMECVRTATKVTDLNIVFFTFIHRNGRPDAWIDADLSSRGLFWTVGVDTELIPEPLYKIVRFTDVCQRVTRLFGSDNYWISCRPSEDQPITLGDVTKYDLVLNYFPNGLPAHWKRKMDESEERNLYRTPYVTDNRVVWSDNARGKTPPTRQMAAEPPPVIRLPKRTEAGGIYVYDSVAAAARATINDIIQEECARQCYCGYHSDSE
jgi:hypothetical protein